MLEASLSIPMAEITDRQRERVQGLVQDLLSLKQISKSHVKPSGKELEDDLLRLKRRALDSAEQKLCSILLDIPPSRLVDARSQGFKRLKRVLQERVTWRKWLESHRSKWREAEEERRRNGEGRNKGKEDEDQDLQGSAFLDSKLLDLIEEPCLVCSGPIPAVRDALLCDGCQGPFHLPCIDKGTSKLSNAAHRFPLPEPELLPSQTAALAVEESDTRHVPLLAAGDWFCPSCVCGAEQREGTGKVALPVLYGRVKPSLGEQGKGQKRFKTLWVPSRVREGEGPQAEATEAEDSKDGQGVQGTESQQGSQSGGPPADSAMACTSVPTSDGADRGMGQEAAQGNSEVVGSEKTDKEDWVLALPSSNASGDVG